MTPTPMRWLMFACAILAIGFWLNGKDAASTQTRGDALVQQIDAIDTEKLGNKVSQHLVPPDRITPSNPAPTRELYTLMICDQLHGTGCHFPDNGPRFFSSAGACAKVAGPHYQNGKLLETHECFKRSVQAWEPVQRF